VRYLISVSLERTFEVSDESLAPAAAVLPAP
jgi:hypothetical protein